MHNINTCLTVLCLRLPRLSGDSEWQWHQLDHMQICTSPRQITMPALHHSVFYKPYALPAGWRGGATVGHRTSDREVVGSIPGRGIAA